MSEPRTRLSTRDIAEAGRREEAQRHREDLRHDARRATAAAASEERPLPAVDSSDVSLFPHDEAEGFRARWEAIQTGFVDEPKTAVAEADALVAQVVTRLAQVFSDEKNTLEQQWGRGDSVSTEDLRIALKRYRAFFHRLLSV
jgi:hypothetical protein